jgi:hypothetical protein
MTVPELRGFLKLRVKSGPPLDDDRDQFERPVWRPWNAPKASKNTQIVPAASVIESISNGPVSQLATVRRKPP